MKYSDMLGRFYLRQSFSKSWGRNRVIIIVKAEHTVSIEMYFKKKRKKTLHIAPLPQLSQIKLRLASTETPQPCEGASWHQGGRRDFQGHQVKRTRLCTEVNPGSRDSAVSMKGLAAKCSRHVNCQTGRIKQKNSKCCAASCCWQGKDFHWPIKPGSLIHC